MRSFRFRWSLLPALAGIACGPAEAPPGGAVVDAAVVDAPATTDALAIDASTQGDVPAASDAAAPPRDARADRSDVTAVDTPRPPVDAVIRDAPAPIDAPRPADAVIPADRGTVDVPPRLDVPAALDARAPDAPAADVPALDGGPFSDAGTVAPPRTRTGPLTAPRIVFTSTAQRGAFWELANGDVLTSFQVSRTPIRPGVAIYDLRYNLRRVSGATVVNAPDTASGTCRDDGRINGCDVGPDPDGPSERSLVTDDGTILVLQRPATDGRSFMRVARLDPTTGTQVPVADYTELRSARADNAYDPPRALRRLGSGQIALTAEMVGVPAATLVLARDGATAVARSEGYAFGERWSPFAVLLGSSYYGPANRYRFWDARTGAQTHLFQLPGAEPGMSAPSFRTFASPAGDVFFPGNTYTDRLIHLGPDGRVVEDRAFTPSGFLGVYPDGAYLTYERYEPGDLGYAARARTGAGSGALLFDDATLVREAGWSPNPRGGFRYPYLLGARRAVIDDAGNAYVAYVLQTGGDSRTETWLAAFARDGRRLWGMRMPSVNLWECHPRAVLSGRRLVVVCPGRYVNRFMILGE